MSKIEKTKEELEKQASGLLTGKSIWIWWISYTVLTGILFCIFYLVWKILTDKWWGIALIILCIGIAWGTISYYNQKSISPVPPSEE